MTTTMRALRFDTYGPPSVLSLREMSVPDPTPEQALVEVHAAAVNPSDVKSVAGDFKAPLPRIPGRDYAGVVVAGLGWKGKAVWGSGSGLGIIRDGAHAEYLVVTLDSLSEKPAHLSMAEAAAVGIPYLAAWAGLVDAAKVQAGETVLITGSLGAVGTAATQIARWRKARVMGVDVSDGASTADAFVNAKTKDFVVEARAWTGGRGVDLVLDCVGGSMFEPCLKSLRRAGRQVAIGNVEQRARVEFSLVDFYHELHTLIGVDTLKLTDPVIARIMTELRAGFEDGHLRPSPIQTWRLDQGVEAYVAVEKRTPKKQVLLLRP
jgi:NADPH:quinone reductase-like Zn-dependent oxidoreductase